MLSTLKSLSLLLLSSNLITPILSLPADSSPAPSPLKSSLDKREIERQRREALSSFPYIGHEQRDLEQRSAGLFWGPKEVGNLKLYIVNPEEGYAGPKFPWANHINVHVDKKIPGPRGDFKPVVNLHVVKYSSGDKSNCLYAWYVLTLPSFLPACWILGHCGLMLGLVRQGFGHGQSGV